MAFQLEKFKIILYEKDYISDFIRTKNYWEIHTTEVINEVSSLYPPEEIVFVDVGANLGYFSLLMASKNIPVIAFEPVQANFDMMTRSIKENNFESLIALHKIALGEKEGEIVLNVYKSNMGLCTVNEITEVAERISERVAETVIVNPLSKYIKDDGRVYIIKIDVEEMEVEVLAGIPPLANVHICIEIKDTNFKKVVERMNELKMSHVINIGFDSEQVKINWDSRHLVDSIFKRPIDDALQLYKPELYQYMIMFSKTQPKQNLLIFGGTGSLSYALVNRFINRYNIIVYSRDEEKQWRMRQKYPTLTYIIGCIRNKESVKNAILNTSPHIIIIAAAMKHIDQCETNINECILTNLTGVQNVIDTTSSVSIPSLHTVLFVSTDKACSPVNVYGMCKSIAERMMIEKSQYKTTPKYVNVRYGNVLNSRGSLLPLFNSIGVNPLKTEFCITDNRMTRFFMTLEQSVKLIENAIYNGESGDTFIPKVPSYRIRDIAEWYSIKYNKSIKVTGLRPGEKLFECLVNITESSRTVDSGAVFIIKPCYKNHTGNMSIEEYDSNTDIHSLNQSFISLICSSIDIGLV